MTLVMTSMNTSLAGTFFSDFNSGAPGRTTVFGSAAFVERGGVDDSGMLQLTRASGSQMGSFGIEPIDGKARIMSFVATFKLFIGGGTGADGCGFGFHSSRITDSFTGGSRTGGFTVNFDTYKNNENDRAPAIRIYSNKVAIATQSVRDLRKQRFVDVLIRLDPDGTLDVNYDGETIFSDVLVLSTNIAGHFAFGARTGSHHDKHLIDDLRIETEVNARAFVEAFSPSGDNVSPSPTIIIAIREHGTRVKSDSIRMTLDKKIVMPTVLKTDTDVLLQFEPGQLLLPGSSHAVGVSFVDDGVPPLTNTFSYNFVVSRQVQLSK